jgi:hypothetical protein
MNAEINQLINSIDGGALFNLKSPEKQIIIGLFLVGSGIVLAQVLEQYLSKRNADWIPSYSPKPKKSLKVESSEE